MRRGDEIAYRVGEDLVIYALAKEGELVEVERHPYTGCLSPKYDDLAESLRRQREDSHTAAGSAR